MCYFSQTHHIAPRAHATTVLVLAFVLLFYLLPGTAWVEQAKTRAGLPGLRFYSSRLTVLVMRLLRTTRSSLCWLRFWFAYTPSSREKTRLVLTPWRCVTAAPSGCGWLGATHTGTGRRARARRQLRVRRKVAAAWRGRVRHPPLYATLSPRWTRAGFLQGYTYLIPHLYGIWRPFPIAVFAYLPGIHCNIPLSTTATRDRRAGPRFCG